MSIDYQAGMSHFFSILFEVHPRIDFRTPMNVLLEERRFCESNAGYCETISDFYRLASRFLSLVGDGHTGVQIPETSWVQPPLELQNISGEVVVSDVLSDGLSISKGDVVLAVDGREVHRVLHEELIYHPCAEVAWGLKQATKTMLRRPAQQSDTKEIELLIAKANGQVIKVAVPLLNTHHQIFHHSYWKNAEDECVHPFSVSWCDSDDAVVLKYRVCADRTHGVLSKRAESLGIDVSSIPSFSETCKELFSEIHKRRTSKLILDIRGNGGGDSSVAMGSLYRFLFNGDIKTYGVNLRVSPLLQTAADWAKDIPLGEHHYNSNKIPFPYDSIPGFYTLPESKLDWGTIHPFKGKLVVLINNDTFSSGEWLAVDLYDNGLGTFVGEPTGCGGSVPGEMVYFNIPKVDATLYTCCRFFRRPGLDQGSVKPHIYVRPSIEDFRQHRDVVMETALGL